MAKTLLNVAASFRSPSSTDDPARSEPQRAELAASTNASTTAIRLSG